MKKTIYLLLLSSILFACSKDKNNEILPKMTFADATFNVPKGCTQAIRILLDKPVATATQLKLNFAGTAIKGTDYTVESETISIKQGDKEAIVNITIPYTITESKKIEVSFAAPIVGYEFGRFVKASITTTLDKTTIFSFSKANDEIPGDNNTFNVNLFDQQGKAFNVVDATNINLEVNSSSTAVLGTHFRFKNNENFVKFPKGKNIGTFSIEVLKYEEGKTSIVLECGDKNGYFGGAVPQMTITIPKRMGDRLVGEWKGLDFYKLGEFVTSWGLDEQQKAALPTCTSSDIINFKSDKSFTITSAGKLKNYFRNCTWNVEGSDLITLGTSYPPEKYIAPRCNLSQVNYLFTSAKESLKAAKINVVITSTSEYKEVLVLQINEHGNDSDFSFIYSDPLTFRFIRK